MDAQDFRSLQEAYNQVHQVDEDAGIVSGLVGLALGAKGALHAAKKTKRLRDYPKNFVKGIADPRTYFPKNKKDQQKEQVDLYDIILSHLIDEGYAETPEAAERIMVNMSEEWKETILEITGGKGHPGYKAGSRDLGPMQSGHPADSSKRTMKGGTMSMRHGDHLGDLDDNDDDDDDGLEAGLKDSAKKSRENVRKPLRNMVKTAAKRLNKESYDQQLDEISQKTATRAFAQRATNEFETDQTSKKSDATKSRIEKKFGKKAGAHAERAAHANIFGRKSSSMPKESYDLYDIILSHLLDEGYADTQEAAERIMVNMSEDWRESIVETRMDPRGRPASGPMNVYANPKGKPSQAHLDAVKSYDAEQKKKTPEQRAQELADYKERQMNNK